jgi:hypothetical protein
MGLFIPLIAIALFVCRKFSSLRHHDHRHDTSSFICLYLPGPHDMISFLKSHGPFYYLSTFSFALVLFVFLIVFVCFSSPFLYLICAHGALLSYLSLTYIDVSLTPRFSVAVVCLGCLYDAVVVS